MNKRKYKPHVYSYLEKDIRFDGRGKADFRPITLEKGILPSAEGSARVTIGKTEVIVGIKMELGTPYPDTPDQGTIMVGAEFLPMASRAFEAGPPGEAAVELARVVDRGIRESHAIDFHKLCIKSGKKMWMIAVDICTINDAGNLLDASGLGTLAAIQDAVFPVLNESEDGDYSINYKEKTTDKITMTKVPIPVTVHKIGEHFIVDPSVDEEAESMARLTVTSIETGQLCALQKGGKGVLTVEDIDAMVTLAVEKSNELRSKL